MEKGQGHELILHRKQNVKGNYDTFQTVKTLGWDYNEEGGGMPKMHCPQCSSATIYSLAWTLPLYNLSRSCPHISLIPLMSKDILLRIIGHG